MKDHRYAGMDTCTKVYLMISEINTHKIDWFKTIMMNDTIKRSDFDKDDGFYKDFISWIGYELKGPFHQITSASTDNVNVTVKYCYESNR